MNKTKNIIIFILMYSIILIIISYKAYTLNKSPINAFLLVFICTILFYKYIKINYNKFNQYNKYTKYKLDKKKKHMNNKVSYRYYYSFWILIWAILIKLNIINVSCFSSIIVSSVFCIILFYFILNNINNINKQYISFIILLHVIGIMFLPYDLSYKTNMMNFSVFLLYLFFLAIHNTTFEQLYYDYSINYLPYTELSFKYFKNLLNI